MYSHITRSETRTLLGGTRYRLTAQIHATTDELRIIRHSRLGRIEVFHDPRREEFAATAAAAHAKAKARGLFVTKARDATAIASAEFCRCVKSVNPSSGDFLRQLKGHLN